MKKKKEKKKSKKRFRINLTGCVLPLQRHWKREFRCVESICVLDLLLGQIGSARLGSIRLQPTMVHNGNRPSNARRWWQCFHLEFYKYYNVFLCLDIFFFILADWAQLVCFVCVRFFIYYYAVFVHKSIKLNEKRWNTCIHNGLGKKLFCFHL